jgi:type VI secretion system secreted protein VgrG
MSTQNSTHIAATDHVNLISGQSTHIAAGKSLLVSVGEKISLFVQNAGIKLFAAKGKVEIKAQSDNVEFTAQKTLRLLSATEKIEAAADQEILLTSGGAYIRISGGNIDIHAPGMIDVKGAQHSFNGPAGQGYPLPAARPDQPGQLELLHQYANGEPVKGGQFSVLDANGGLLRQGALDANGRMTVSGLPPGVAQVQFGIDPRDPSQPVNYFKSIKWPVEPLNASGDATAASQMASFLPAASNASGATVATGAASAAGTMASAAKGAMSTTAGGASQLASLASVTSQGSSGLASMAKSQATGLAQSALAKALPSGGSAALSQASQAASAAKEISGIAQSARSALPAIKGVA